MKTCPSCVSKKPLSEFHNNRGCKDGKEVYCKECKKAKCRDSYRRHREKKLAYCAEYQQENREKKTEYMRLHRAGKSRPEGRTVEWTRGADYDELREQRNAIIRKSKKKHAHRVAANNAKRRASKLRRTPGWAEAQEITDLYAQAKQLTALTGKQFHVDHIIPLQATEASGLHVLSNLQIVTAQYNLSKRHSMEVAA